MFSFPPLSTMSRPIKNRPCSIQSPVYRDIELTVIVNYESVADHRRHNSYDKLGYIFGKSCLRVLISIFANTPLFNLLKTSETRRWQNQLNKIINNKPTMISIKTWKTYFLERIQDFIFERSSSIREKSNSNFLETVRSRVVESSETSLKQLSRLTAGYRETNIVHVCTTPGNLDYNINRLIYTVYECARAQRFFTQSRTCLQIPRYRAYKSLDSVLAPLPRTRSGEPSRFPSVSKKIFHQERPPLSSYSLARARCETLPTPLRPRYLSTTLMDIYLSRWRWRERERKRERKKWNVDYKF